jgi:ATP-dependent exoDNAse (exonuclease V) alpha subunit
MAIYHNHKSSVQRSKGQNAVASAAYISRSKLVYNVMDKETGVITEEIYDYSDKAGLVYSKIYTPGINEGWVLDREKLWNKAEEVEVKGNARSAYKIILALSKEFTEEQQIDVVDDYADFLNKQGIIADINIHYDRENNPHAHIQMTTRELLQSENGELVFGKKIREWQTIPFLRLQREEWGNIVNQHLEFHGHLDRISHLSHKARGIDLIPGVHQGPANYIKSAELTQLNEEIVKENAIMIRDNPELIFQKLSINKPVFTPEDIAKVLSEVLYSSIELSEVAKEQGGVSAAFKSDNIEQLNTKYSTEFMVTYEQLLASKNITLINPCDLKGRKLYALTKRIQLEQRYEQTVEQLADSHRHALNVNVEAIDHRTLTEELVEGIYALGREVQTIVNDKAGLELNLVAKEQPSLTTEQKQAVVQVLNGSDVSVLEGWPGAGKTHSMRAIVKQYQRAGYKVLGAAPSSAAALTLAKAAGGVEAKNIAQWRKSWQEERGVKFELALRSDYYSEAQYQHQLGGLDAKTVLIVDEASMVELANMDYLVNEV